MPSYKYFCPNCGNVVHKIFSIKDYDNRPIVICDNCNQEMKRDFNLNDIGVIFKSKGFYVTDNKKDNSKS